MPPVDHIRYDLLAQDALRGVVRRVLSDAARNGLPGDHHFFVSFDTRAPGVRLSKRMREKYPEEMTVVLQHQFWDLTVTDHAFEVGLSFGGVPERLLVPFTSIKGFLDPSVKFGLQFEVADAEAVEDVEDTAEAPALAPVRSLRGAASEPALASGKAQDSQEETVAEGTSGASPGKAEPNAAAKSEPIPQGGAEVVRLDVFRKK